MPKLQVLMVSTRPGRVGLPVAEWFIESARQHGGFEIEVVDLAEVPSGVHG
jgi:NAD(P)H-dependent FMN reductase